MALNNGGTNYNLTFNTNSTTNSTSTNYYNGGNVVIGAGDGGTPFGGLLRGPNAGNSNTTGGNLALNAGWGTGTAAGGSIFVNGGTTGTGSNGNAYLRGGYSNSAEGAVYLNDDHGGSTFINSAGGIVTVGSATPGTAQMNLSGGLVIDNTSSNSGSISNAVGTTGGNSITFGSSSGEGIASKRTSGGNQYGLDFYTGTTNRMSISNTGGVTINSLGTGMVKSTSGLLANATAGTDYQAPMSGGTGISISSNTINSTWTTTGSNIYNNTGGYVGIGTGSTSQTNALTINGSGGFWNNNELNFYTGNTTGTLKGYVGCIVLRAPIFHLPLPVAVTGCVSALTLLRLPFSPITP